MDDGRKTTPGTSQVTHPKSPPVFEIQPLLVSHHKSQNIDHGLCLFPTEDDSITEEGHPLPSPAHVVDNLATHNPPDNRTIPSDLPDPESDTDDENSSDILGPELIPPQQFGFEDGRRTKSSDCDAKDEHPPWGAKRLNFLDPL